MTTPFLNRILLVEDDPDIQVMVDLALQDIGGFTVKVCSSGIEAVKTAPIFNPDLILLDVMMPHMSGPSTLEALRQIPQTALTPVIFLTAKVQPYEVGYYKELGALDVIAKPFDPIALAATLRSIWAERYG